MLCLLIIFLCAVSAAAGFVLGMFLATRGTFKAFGITPPSVGEWLGWFSH